MRDAAARGRALSRAIESTLGRAAFEAFRATSRAFQRDRVSCERFHDYLTAVLHAHPGLLLEVLATLPDDANRRRLESLASRAEAAAASAERDERASDTVDRECRVEILEPGIVLLRGALDAETQAWLADEAFRVGDSSGDDNQDASTTDERAEGRRFESDEESKARRRRGFYDVVPADDPASAPVLRLNQGTRGRVILPIDRFPERLRRLTLSCVALARSATRETPHPMPAMRPTTTLVNFYKENASFKWHRDSEDPELQRTNKAPPIVSFTVGLSAEFAYKRRFEDAEHASVRLDSGDAFLFGGPARMIAHSVLRVLPNTTPGALRGRMRLNGRLNVTVRDIGRGVIDESAFPAYRVTYGGEVSQDHV